MKEYLLTFSNPSCNKRKLWTDSEYQKFIPYIGKTDKNGVTLLSIETIK